MRNRTLQIDLVIAVVATIVLVIVSPGLAVVGLVAVIVLLGCGMSLLVDRMRARARARPPGGARRTPPRSTRRPPPRTVRRPPSR